MYWDTHASREVLMISKGQSKADWNQGSIIKVLVSVGDRPARNVRTKRGERERVRERRYLNFNPRCLLMRCVQGE